MMLLHRVVGMRLERLYAHRYPGYLAYSQLVAVFGDGLSIRFDLSDETIAPKFEVFVVRARPAEQPSEVTEWDRIELSDFVVASVFLLRRKEWVEKGLQPTIQTVGSHGVVQRFGTYADGDDKENAAIVDSGVSFSSMSGAELTLEADTFPLVLQLHYQVASSQLPRGERIPVNRHRSPQ